MPYDAERARRNLIAIMRREKLKPTPWALASGLSKNAITSFLNGQTESLTIATITKLAEQAELNPMELTGFDPPPEYLRLVAALNDMVAALEPSSSSEETAAMLEQTRALLESRLPGPQRRPALLPPPKEPWTRR